MTTATTTVSRKTPDSHQKPQQQLSPESRDHMMMLTKQVKVYSKCQNTKTQIHNVNKPDSTQTIATEIDHGSETYKCL